MIRPYFLAWTLVLCGAAHGLGTGYFEPAATPGVFLVRTARGTLSVRGHQITLQSGSQSLRMDFGGGAASTFWRAIRPSSGHSTYLLGTNAARTAGHFSEIQAAEIYPGISARLRFGDTGLEYDFIVAPGANPSRIRMQFPREARLHIEASGDLIADYDSLTIRHKPPRAFQGTREVRARFQMQRNSRVRFSLDPYDRTQPLVIDPVLVFTNFLGGSSNDAAYAVAADAAGNIYVAGTTNSADFPRTATLPSGVTQNLTDVFVTKLDPTGQQVLYSVYFGGKDQDLVAAIAVDSQGSVYAAGFTQSTDFPTTAGVYGAANPSTSSYVVKLNPQGTGFAYSTILGRAGLYDGPSSIVIDAAGDAFVAGVADYGAFPVTPGAWRTAPAQGTAQPFLAELNPQGSQLVFGTFVPMAPTSIALAADGSIWLAGGASSTSFPTSPGFSNTFNGSGAAVLRINPTGTAATFGALMGGSGGDAAYGVALDSSGMVYMTGGANSGSNSSATHPFPTTPGAASNTFQENVGFLAKIDPTAAKLVYSTYINAEQNSGFAADAYSVRPAADGSVWVFAQGGTLLNFAGYDFGPTVTVTGYALVHVSADGSAVLSIMELPTSGVASAGWDNQHLYVATYTQGGAPPQVEPAYLTPGAQPIGPPGGISAVVSVVDLTVNNAPSLLVNAGYLYYAVPPNAKGGYSPVTTTLSLTSTGAPIRFHVSVPQIFFGLDVDTPVSVSPTDGVTPAQLAVTTDVTKFPTSEPVALVITETGAAEAMTAVAIAASEARPTLAATQAPFPAVQAGQTVTTTLAVSATVSGTWSSLPVQVPFQITRPRPQPWLTFATLSGVTPQSVTLTANTTGLAPGTYVESLTLSLGGGAPSLGTSSTIILTVGTSTSSAAPVVSTPSALSFSFAAASGKQTRTVHLDSSSGAPVAFSISQPASYLTISPMSGTTPVDLSVTADASQLPVGMRTDSVVLAAASVQEAAFRITTVVGYTIYSFSEQASTSGPSIAIAPGALVVLYASNINNVNAQASGPPWPTVLGGLSVSVNGTLIPLSSIASNTIVGQMPYGIAAGPANVSLQTAAGNVLASINATISSGPVPGVVAASQVSAQKTDGSPISLSNPVQVGDTIVLRLTGQGALSTPVAAGNLPGAGTVASPVAPVTAEIGGLPAQVVSAQMSATAVGVLEVHLVVPNLYNGDQWIHIQIGSGLLDYIPIYVTSAAAPSVNLNGVVNAASFARGAVAPGSLVSVFGLNFAPGSSSASTVPLPVLLGNAAFSMGGVSAPLLLVSANQINLQVPWELTGQTSAMLSENLNGATTPFAQPVALTAYSPAIFTAGGGQGVAIIHGTGLLAAPLGPGSRPVLAGEYLEIYATGLGPVSNTPASGAASPSNPVANTTTMPLVTIGGIPATPSFSGLSPGLVGLYQINVQVPTQAPAGSAVPLVVQIGNVSSNTVTIAVGAGDKIF